MANDSSDWVACCAIESEKRPWTMDSYSVESWVRDYHIYKDVWEASISEDLLCRRKSGNTAGTFTMAVMKNGATVGHITLKNLFSFSLLIFVIATPFVQPRVAPCASTVGVCMRQCHKFSWVEIFVAAGRPPKTMKISTPRKWTAIWYKCCKMLKIAK